MKSIYLFVCLSCFSRMLWAQPDKQHNLTFDKLAPQWDEAIPLGNGMIGALIWGKDNTLRLSLDRADLWDERQAFPLEQHNFKWVQEQVKNETYKAAQAWGDHPYDASPYPTKLPAAALAFDLIHMGKVISNELDLTTAINTIRFDNGTTVKNFIHATLPIGYFEISASVTTPIDQILPQLLPHLYETKNQKNEDGVSVVSGQSLARLGYKQGTLNNTTNRQLLHQPTYDGRYFEVLLEWKKIGNNKLIGAWTIANNEAADLSKVFTDKALAQLESGHIAWWTNYWSKSSVSFPDPLLERQYYLEMYKLGSVAREGAPAITLQAVWTADNGGLPPWKGDFHNDLNTQLSYWPAYTGNRLPEAKTFTDWLWKVRPENKRYTKHYFGVEGLNIPGVLTLNGYPMGGWIQYALSPTVSAWTAHHFYWQWKYSMDDNFLKEQAFTYITEAATFLKNITFLKENGKRYLPLSASPEYNNNDITAWFKDWTNFDLALANFIFSAAAEVNQVRGNKAAAQEWTATQQELPAYAADETGMLVAVGQPMEHSHRHMSPYMAIYPMNQLDINRYGDKDVIKRSMRHLEKLGTKQWVGYSFSWIASMHARAKEADEAVSNLKKFASNFCSINSFHVNGDQKGGEYSGFTYRPFTLEGNFAFAQGVHELLLQSKGTYVEVFPATPKNWSNVSFTDLRTEGGFLISAAKQNGILTTINVKADANGTFTIRHEGDLNVADAKKKLTKKQTNEGQMYSISLKKGEKVALVVGNIQVSRRPYTDL